MREIKFRAWDKYNGMTDCFCIHSSGLVAYKNNDWLTDEEKPVLMQYTGLKDKNGKEIYEGDILCYENNTYDQSEGDAPNFIGKVLYKDGCFFVTNDEDKKWLELLAEIYEAEIIGNIYENPELLYD